MRRKASYLTKRRPEFYKSKYQTEGLDIVRYTDFSEQEVRAPLEVKDNLLSARPIVGHRALK